MELIKEKKGPEQWVTRGFSLHFQPLHADTSHMQGRANKRDYEKESIKALSNEYPEAFPSYFLSYQLSSWAAVRGKTGIRDGCENRNMEKDENEGKQKSKKIV